MIKLKEVVTASAVMMAFGAHAAEKGFTHMGTVKGGFQFGLSDTNKKNEFALEKIYLGGTHGFSDGWSAAAQYDLINNVARLASISGQDIAGGSVTLGLSKDTYVSNLDSVHGAGWLVENVAEAAWGFDRNFGLTYAYGSDMFDIAVDVTNAIGVGDTVANDKSLALGADVSVKPNDMIKILGSFSYQMEDTDNTIPKVMGWGVGVGVNHEMIDLLGEVASVQIADADASMAYGATAHLKFGDLGLLGQFVTGNDGYKAANGTDLVVGVTNKFTQGVNGALAFKNNAPESGDGESSIELTLAADF